VTTAGFGDTLYIRNEHRYDMYDLQIEFPPPPIPRDLTFEIVERSTADGEVLVQPSDADIERLASRIQVSDVEAVAVCFLHAYANAANERRVTDALAARLGLPICASSEVAPQIREYPRMVTTACNAATMPVVGPYLDDFRRWLTEQGFGGSLLIMLSNGGVVDARDAARTPVRMVESGPAAGALAGAWYAERLGETRLLCFDMGGTTAKSCLIEDSEPALTNDFEVARIYRFKKGSGFPVIVPSIDLVEVGAGGGSIARVDDLALLKVGPDSSGADPGPACYGRGGTQGAVTDADLVLGNLDPAYFLGGDMPLDVEAAEQALTKVADPLGLSVLDAAVGVHDLVNQNMAAASRMHAVERGLDLRGVSLIAFGGAGPVHACGVAELLQSPRVVFPANASVLSAFGALVTPVRIDLARSYVRVLADVSVAERERLLDEMRDEGRRILSAAGVASEAVRFRYGVDARYQGQGNEITVWLGEGQAFPVADVEAAFAADYGRVYGMTIPDVPVEIVTWRVSSSAPAPAVGLATTVSKTSPAPIGTRPVRFSRRDAPVDTPVYRRETLGVGDRIEGPAIVEERDTTCVLRRDWTAQVSVDGSLIATPSPTPRAVVQ
jgi:N-methylhydantoinase A